VDKIGVDASKIVVLPNGVDPDVFAPASGDGISRHNGLEGKIVIGFVGILRPWHGVDRLLAAFRTLRAQHPPVHLLIVGDGPIQPELETLARELGVSAAVTFTGRLQHGDVVRHVAAMDLCVSPHATFYASPMKILEYMAVEKAVVAPAMDNIRDLIVDGRTGVLFDPARPEALAATLLKVAKDTPLRRTLGQNARRAVLERFNWRHNAMRIAESAQELVSSWAGAGGRS
jgi:glycosyltransferase involved in cell wall biosynthesis